jgi:hypothetical protein
MNRGFKIFTWIAWLIIIILLIIMAIIRGHPHSH